MSLSGFYCRSVVAVALAGAVALWSGGCAPREPATKPDRAGERGGSTSGAAEGPSSQERMLRELAAIRRDGDESNQWQGEGPARRARQRLEALGPGGDSLRRWAALLEVAEHELRLGNEETAIARFTEARELLPELAGRLPPERALHTVLRLGVAYLRLGETRNCADGHAAEACILPLGGAALHRDRYGSTQGLRVLLEAARMAPPSSPTRIEIAWLASLAAMTLGEFPNAVPPELRLPAELFTSAEAFPRLENVAAKLGVDSFNLFGGAAVDDFDGDGVLDIVTTTFDLAGDPHAFFGDGDGGFEDRTDEAGLSGFYGGLNLVQADYDNDGDLDLYVLRGAWLYSAGRHPNSLWRNDGGGRFEDVTFSAGLGEVHYPTQTAAWADYDNDGWVDLYVGNEHGDGRSRVGLEDGDGALGFDAPSQLFHNNGDGTFTDVASSLGVDVRAFVKGVVWGDYDGDRWPDLYVSVLGDRNRLFRNLEGRGFEDVAGTLGVDRPLNSFPVWFWDYDNDGVLDLWVSSYRGAPESVALVAASALGLDVPYERMRLYRGNGNGGFEDVTERVGLDRLHLPMGANFGDLDGDGWLDFYLGTGYPDYEGLVPNVLYRNHGGRQFVDVTYAAGVGHLQKGHAVAFADLDADGDLDLFAQMGGAFPGDRFRDALFRNPGFGHHWLALRLAGRRTNRAAIGARVRVDVGRGESRRSVFRHVTSGGSFGASPLLVWIGLGRADHVERIEISWPTSDEVQVVRPVAVDRTYRVIEGVEGTAPLAAVDAPSGHP